MSMSDIINVLSNFFLGIGVVGTIIVLLMFLALKLFKVRNMEKLIASLCIFFSVSWLINILCNVYLLFLAPK